MHLKEFNIRIENIISSVLSGSPSDEEVVKAIVRLKDLIDAHRSEVTVAEDRFGFVIAYGEFIDTLHGKLSVKLDENRELKSGESLAPAAVQFTVDSFVQFKDFINGFDRDLEEEHDAAIKEAKAKGTTPCSLCKLKAIKCAGIEGYMVRGN